MTNRIAVALSLVAILMAPIVTSAAATPGASPNDDANVYADRHRISVDEAVRRLSLQTAAGELAATLDAIHPSGFAGLWIEHEPSFQVVIAAVPSAMTATRELVRSTVLSTTLDDSIVFRPAPYALDELVQAQNEISGFARLNRLDTSTDIMRGRVLISASDDNGLNAIAHASLPEAVVAMASRTVGRSAADAYAGANLSNGCSSGFTMIWEATNPDTFFTTTAGHCSNTASLNGITISYNSEIFAGNYDIQHGSVSSLTPRNLMRVSPTTLRSVQGRTTKAAQAINSFICKYGRTTGQTCGYLASKTFQPSWVPGAAPVFHQVQPRGGPDMVNGGDSGGPVYSNANAWGMVSGEYGLPWCVCDLIYDPIPYIEENSLEPQQSYHVYYVP